MDEERFSDEIVTEEEGGTVMVPMNVETEDGEKTADVYIDYYTSCVKKISPFLAMIALLVVIINGGGNAFSKVKDSAKTTTDNNIDDDGLVAAQAERAKEHAKEVQDWDYVDVGEHYLDKGVLEFFDWEVQSVNGIEHVPDGVKADVEAKRTCNPPNGIPTKCCIGSYTTHLKIIDSYRQHCGNVGESVYADILHTVRTSYIETNQTAMHCDICRIADLVGQGDLTVSFIGDGMSMQMFYGLACEFYRRNYETKEIAMHYIECTKEVGGLCPLKYKQVEVMTEKGLAKFKFFFQAEASLDDPERDQLIVANADVLVLNFGLQWEHDDRDEHMKKVQELFHTITDYKKHENQLVLFREPSAQHFEAQGGDRSFYDGKTKECTPLDESELEIAKWRDDTVKKGAQNAHFTLVEINSQTMKYPALSSHKSQHQELVVLPFFDFTKPYYSMHPTNNGGSDCHHFCSSPYFYMPIWRTLRLAMDRQYFGGKLGHPKQQHKKKGFFGW